MFFLHFWKMIVMLKALHGRREKWSLSWLPGHTWALWLRFVGASESLMDGRGIWSQGLQRGSGCSWKNSNGSEVGVLEHVTFLPWKAVIGETTCVNTRSTQAGFPLLGLMKYLVKTEPVVYRLLTEKSLQPICKSDSAKVPLGSQLPAPAWQRAASDIFLMLVL